MTPEKLAAEIEVEVGPFLTSQREDVIAIIRKHEHDREAELRRENEELRQANNVLSAELATFIRQQNPKGSIP